MRTFPLDITEEERAFGFVVALGSGQRGAAIANLGFGLRAVKVREAGGSTRYLVCDEMLEPLYHSAASLDELRERFLAQGL